MGDEIQNLAFGDAFTPQTGFGVKLSPNEQVVQGDQRHAENLSGLEQGIREGFTAYGFMAEKVGETLMDVIWARGGFHAPMIAQSTRGK